MEFLECFQLMLLLMIQFRIIALKSDTDLWFTLTETDCKTHHGG